MTKNTAQTVCIVCNRGTDEVALMTMEYRDSTFRICPQHLPVLIHDPAQLADRLPGAEKMKPAEGHH